MGQYSLMSDIIHGTVFADELGCMEREDLLCFHSMHLESQRWEEQLCPERGDSRQDLEGTAKGQAL